MFHKMLGVRNTSTSSSGVIAKFEGGGGANTSLASVKNRRATLPPAPTHSAVSVLMSVISDTKCWLFLME